MTGFLILILAAAWYLMFDRDIALPSLESIKKIEVCQNDFKQRSQQITYIEEQSRIQKIYEFIDKRKKGWETRLYAPTAPVVTADFYGKDGILIELYLMKSSNFLLRNSNGAYLKSLRNDELNEIFGLLGTQAGMLTPAERNTRFNKP